MLQCDRGGEAVSRMNWYAVYVNSRAEKKTGALLAEKGFEAYVPLVKTTRQWSDRKKLVELPLMNGYVFVKINEAAAMHVLQTRGVVNFVRAEGRMAPIREEEIERLKQVARLGYQVEVNPAAKSFGEGDKVKITAGLLKGLEGIVSRSAQGQFLEIMLESLGHSIKVKLPDDIVIPV